MHVQGGFCPFCTGFGYFCPWTLLRKANRNIAFLSLFTAFKNHRIWPLHGDGDSLPEKAKIPLAFFVYEMPAPLRAARGAILWAKTANGQDCLKALFQQPLL